MVGGVASYTGIIEQGIEQQRGAKPMTTNQNDTSLMTDVQLDTVAGGAIAIPNLIEARRSGVAGRDPISIAPFPIHISDPGPPFAVFP